MTDDAPFLRAICEAPDDDAPRLIYADWLNERGECERAEFIRVQCRLARLKVNDADYVPTGDRVRELLDEDSWLKDFPLTRTPYLFADGSREVQEQAARANANRTGWQWARGFIHSITCTAADAIAHLDSIRERHPVREVRFFGGPPLTRLSIAIRDQSPWTSWAVEVSELKKINYQPIAEIMDRLDGRVDDAGRPVLVSDEEHAKAILEELIWPAVTFHLPEIVRGRLVQVSRETLMNDRTGMLMGPITASGEAFGRGLAAAAEAVERFAEENPEAEPVTIRETQAQAARRLEFGGRPRRPR